MNQKIIIWECAVGGTLLPEYNHKCRKMPLSTTLILVMEDCLFHLYGLLGSLNCIFLIDSGFTGSLVPRALGWTPEGHRYYSNLLLR